jgi:hypothetical protein
LRPSILTGVAASECMRVSDSFSDAVESTQEFKKVDGDVLNRRPGKEGL